MALIDPGSMYTIVDLDLRKSLTTEGHEDKTLTLRLANGSTMEAKGSAVVQIGILGTQYPHRVVFMRDALYSIILGLDFIKKHNMHLDFISNSYYFGENCSVRARFIDNGHTTHADGQVAVIDDAYADNEMLTLKEAINRAPIDEDQKTQLLNLFRKYSKVFSGYTGLTSASVHYINTGNHSPISCPPHRVTPARAAIISSLVQDMLEQGLIEPGTGPWASPAMAIPKKDGSYRLVVDYRELNKITLSDAYPMPRIDDILDTLKNPKFITTIDLRSGFWQIPLHEESRQKAAFVTPDGLFQPKILQMGLKGAPKTFMRTMDNLLRHLRKDGVLVYLDDIIIASHDFQHHLLTIGRVLQVLSRANLTAKASKVQIALPSAKILGHIVSERGIEVDPSKTKAISEFAQPKSVKQVRTFLGMAGYYRRFIAGFAKIAAPLTNLTKKNTKFKWSIECQTSFLTLKDKLRQPPILHTADFSLPFVVHTDASNYAIGAVLQQEVDGQLRPIQFASRVLQATEQKYATTEREALAIVWAVQQFRPYLDMQRFVVFTDHNCLRWIQNQKDPTGRLTRWALKLQAYDMEIKYIKGSANVVADALSRNNEPDCSTTSDGAIHVSAILPGNRDTDLSPAEIIAAQDSCPSLSRIRRALQQGQTGEEHTAELSSYMIRDEILWKRITTDNTLRNYRIVIPPTLTDRVIFLYHDLPNCGHLGVKKTLHRLKERFTWPRMSLSVSRYIRSCHKCQRYKGPNNTPMGLMKSADIEQPFDTLAVDLVGPLPRSKNGNTTLLVIHDCMTKFVQLHPLRAATATKIAKILVEKCFLTFGAPKRLVSDNGRQFISNIMKQVARLFGIKQKFTSVYAPQSNPTERTNRTVKNIMAIYAEENHRTWDEALSHIAAAINGSVQESTGFTPNFLMFGRELRMPQDPLISSALASSAVTREHVATHAATLMRRVREAIETARANLKRAQIAQKRVYDRHHRAGEFEKGQLVLKATHTLSSAIDSIARKLAPKFDGPFRIEEKLSPLTYRLRDCATKKLLPGTHHIRNLKLYHGRQQNE